ncbi:hypothetical protein HF521_018084 [Silurus meridionalis]|uniref:Uncharacterized protein n=1 Tax=Silurus meridionalis TaxID=175797 RepID=A0A8T0BU43_SILME|nr:hypothetical protein HF521_018084 [Silurus meridionalis]
MLVSNTRSRASPLHPGHLLSFHIHTGEDVMAEDIQQKLQQYRTAPFDARFPNQNQTRNCWQNYLDREVGRQRDDGTFPEDLKISPSSSSH